MFHSVRIGVGVMAMVIAAMVFNAGTQAAKTQVWVGRLVIDNPAGGTEGILHDCVGAEGEPVPEECEYTDYRWPPSVDARRDPCVLGDIYATGLAFFALDRNFDNGVRCTEQPDAEDQGYKARRFTVRVPDEFVCSYFGFATAPCNLLTERNPIIRVESVFKNKATKTKVGFIWGGTAADGDTRAYRINTLQDASITGITNSKFVTYNGPVTMFNLAGTMPEYTFQLAFSFQVVRRPL
jgi:hypothetical protein